MEPELKPAIVFEHPVLPSAWLWWGGMAHERLRVVEEAIDGWSRQRYMTLLREHLD